MKMLDVSWLAGIIEGEGNFSFTDTPKIKVKMTDEDIVRNVAHLFKRPYYPEPKKEKHHKDLYYVSICGQPAIEWMFTLYSLMGIRRKNQILCIIQEWKVSETTRNRDTFGCGCPKTPENTLKYGKYTKCKSCNQAQNNRYRIQRLKRNGQTATTA
jgi:hypothetical protein